MITTLNGDCREMLQTLPVQSVQCVVTSPPYYGLRRYTDDPREIGQEATPALYVAALVEVFRQLRRVLRDDGTVWLNLGDSYAGSWGNYGGQNRGKGTQREITKGSLPSPGYDGRESERPAASVTPDLRNCLQSSIEGRVLELRGRYALTITAKGRDVFNAHQIAPDSELAPLLGVKRIFIKQGNDNFCQVFDLLDTEGCLWISRAATFTRVGQAQADIILNACDHISIVVSEHNLNHQASLSIPVLSSAAEYAEMPFAVEKTSEPIAESIGHSQPVGDSVALNSTSESLLQVDLVNDLVATSESLTARSSGLRDFRITKASDQHFALTMLQGGLDLTVRCVGHLFASNEYGSLIRYTELYDKAYRLSNSLKAKQLIGIPWMVARALQEDGWILRSDILWSKSNCMPESVTDRPTRAHEYVFLLTKSARYFYDADAIREEPQGDGRKRGAYRNGPRVGQPVELHIDNPAGRNRRTVWTIATQPYSGAHYATMPEALIAPCILAGSSAQACEHCGAAWVRVTEKGLPSADSDRPQQRRAAVLWIKSGLTDQHLIALRAVGMADTGKAQYTMTGYGKNTPEVQRLADEAKAALGGYIREFMSGTANTTGFSPSCACAANTGGAASVVLDPFGGSGTVGKVALRYQRSAVLIELNQAYIDDHIETRTDKVQTEMFV